MIKVSLVVLLALVATRLLRSRSAALRHWVLSAAILFAAATPALQLIAPAWQVTVPARPAALVVAPFTASGSVTLNAPDADASQEPSTLSAWMVKAGEILYVVWLAGAGISFSLLVVGLARLTWLGSHSRRISHGMWAELVDELSLQFGLGRPVRLLQSDHPTLLVTWGILQPKVILPAAAGGWTKDRARIVLSHELAHIRRRDWLLQMVAELLRSANWFNPIVWMACRELRQESEHACDDEVLRLGIEGPDYAAHLIDVARALRSRKTWIPCPAPAIVRPSSLERRVRAMLNVRLNREPITRPARLVSLLALSSLAILIAGLGASAQTAFATFSGAVSDPMGGVLSQVTLVLTNVQSQAKHEVKSDQAGRFEFVGLPPGDYLIESRAIGFATLQGTVTLAGLNKQQNIKLDIGSVTETINVTANPGPPRPPRQMRATKDPAACIPSSTGGNIRPPMKIADVRPIYPEALRDAKIEGKVVMEGRIGTDGYINNLRVVGEAQPDFSTAALDAVRGWQFTSTMLNCVPIEVNIKMTINFLVAPPPPPPPPQG